MLLFKSRSTHSAFLWRSAMCSASCSASCSSSDRRMRCVAARSFARARIAEVPNPLPLTSPAPLSEPTGLCSGVGEEGAEGTGTANMAVDFSIHCDTISCRPQRIARCSVFLDSCRSVCLRLPSVSNRIALSSTRSKLRVSPCLVSKEVSTLNLTCSALMRLTESCHLSKSCLLLVGLKPRSPVGSGSNRSVLRKCAMMAGAPPLSVISTMGTWFCAAFSIECNVPGPPATTTSTIGTLLRRQ
mmetsp:Transcript_10209/g.25697  ORF Transcript_10209/g.25697 Transcript_10209/m.25697 type:complete len:243 (+) Transcript_10209:2666-3394(+)